MIYKSAFDEIPGNYLVRKFLISFRSASNTGEKMICGLSQGSFCHQLMITNQFPYHNLGDDLNTSSLLHSENTYSGLSPLCVK
jgi:hypothetical protein